MAKNKVNEQRDRYAAKKAHAEEQVRLTEEQAVADAEAREFSAQPMADIRAQTKAESLRRKAEHAAAQPDEPAVMEFSERVALERQALDTKAAAGPAENKAAKGPAENKAGDLDSVDFASPQAKEAAEEAGLTADSFKRRRKSSDGGFTKADVERIAATVGADED